MLSNGNFTRLCRCPLSVSLKALVCRLLTGRTSRLVFQSFCFTLQSKSSMSRFCSFLSHSVCCLLIFIRALWPLPTTQLLTEAQCAAQNVAVSGHAKTVIDGVTYIENPTYGGLLYYLYQGVKLGIYPPLIFLGIGCMTDFGPLISNPKSLTSVLPHRLVSF